MYAFILVFRQHIVSVVLVTLITIIAFLLFVDVSNTKNLVVTKDRIDSYILATEGKTIIKSADGSITTLEVQQKKNIRIDDRIRTLANSAATIFWTDGSVTRLGEKTNITVLEIKQGIYGSTQVDFSISEGKSWSNLARWLDPESSFKQRYDNNQKIAAVRGTIFEINVEKGYLRTESHAIEIQDEKGSYLTTVTDGRSVTTDDSIKSIQSSNLDPKWQSQNLTFDWELAQERLQKIKEKLQNLSQKEHWISKIQEYIRKLFWITHQNLPITVNSSSSGISLSIDSSKLSSENTQELLAIYEAISVLNSSEDTLDSKILLREAILQTMPESDAKKYREIFSRATLFDIWDALKNDLPRNTKELQGYLQTYSTQSNTTEEIKRLQEALPMERIDMFNKRMEEWKGKSYETLSDPDWFSKTFKIDSESIMDGILKFNEKVDTTIRDIKN